jgi:hypothetical protein
LGLIGALQEIKNLNKKFEGRKQIEVSLGYV